MTIQRTRNSLGYILEDIANKGDAASIVSQVKFLVKNYQLSSNVQTSVEIIKERKSREEATTHGKAAVEFLAQIYEYFSDQVDDLTGKVQYMALLQNNDIMFSSQGGVIRPLPRGCCTSMVTIHSLYSFPLSLLYQARSFPPKRCCSLLREQYRPLRRSWTHCWAAILQDGPSWSTAS